MKNIATFRNIAILILFIFLAKILYGQQWTEPINISNLGGYSMDPDMVIDHKGVIHVVWSYNVEASHWLIMYTNSKDDGHTWTEPIDLLQNTDLWMLQPHIACDSKNNLYVTYTHDGHSLTPEGRLIKMLTYDGKQWSEPFIISKEMPGSDYSSIAIDQDDKPYVFWLIGAQMGAIEMYYRYLIDKAWSDIYCPYCDSSVGYLPVMYSLEDDVMHWSGVYQIFMVEKPMYFRYNANLNDWANPEVISKDTMNVGIDISLNNNNYPETVYRKTSTTATGVFTDSARYTKKEGFNWNFPELVSGTDKNQVGQQIAVDQNNDVHVLETEYYVSADLETQLVHYFQFGDNWIGQAIDSSDHMCHYPKLLYANNNLYVVYWWHSAELGEGHIRFSKYDIITNIKEEHRQTSELKIYPNPSQGHVTIQFYPSSITGNNKTNQAIRISVFDLNGNHVKNLANKVFPSEKQQVLWNGTNKNGKKVNSGLYLIQLKYGQNTFTQTVEIVY